MWTNSTAICGFESDTPHFEDGVGLATAHPAGLNDAYVLHDIDDQLLARAPAAFAKLLAHLLRGTQQPFWVCQKLAAIVPKLAEHAEPADLEAIREGGLRLGCSEGPGW